MSYMRTRYIQNDPEGFPVTDGQGIGDYSVTIYHVQIPVYGHL